MAAGHDVDERAAEAERLLVVPAPDGAVEVGGEPGTRSSASELSCTTGSSRCPETLPPATCTSSTWAPPAPSPLPASVQSVPGIRITCQPGRVARWPWASVTGTSSGDPNACSRNAGCASSAPVEASSTLPPWPTTQPPTSASARAVSAPSGPRASSATVRSPSPASTRCGAGIVSDVPSNQSRTRSVVASMPPSSWMLAHPNRDGSSPSSTSRERK